MASSIFYFKLVPIIHYGMASSIFYFKLVPIVHYGMASSIFYFKLVPIIHYGMASSIVELLISSGSLSTITYMCICVFSNSSQ